MKKKIIPLTIIAACCIALFFLCKNEQKPSDNGALTLDSAQLEPYLNLKGFDAELTLSEEITLPQKFEGVYADFALSQKNAGFDLEDYKGETVRRFVFKVDNSEKTAELLLSGDKLISAALFDNTESGGFTPIK